MFLEHKALFATKGEVPDGELVDVLGRATTVRPGSDATIVALAAMVPKATEAAEILAQEGVSAEVIDLRVLRPLDAETLLALNESLAGVILPKFLDMRSRGDDATSACSAGVK